NWQIHSLTIASTMMLKILGDSRPPCVTPRLAFKLQRLAVAFRGPAH
ncbi:hypothetical protein THAOC_23884, partial [Thalassiosira oceanica]